MKKIVTVVLDIKDGRRMGVEQVTDFMINAVGVALGFNSTPIDTYRVSSVATVQDLTEYPEAK